MSQELAQIGKRVRFLYRFVGTPAQHARKTHGDTRFVPGAALYDFEAQLEHHGGRYASHRSKLLYRSLTDDRIDFAELFIGKARIRLGKWYELTRFTLRVPQ